MSKFRRELSKLGDSERYSFRGVFVYSGYKESYTPNYWNRTNYLPTFMIKDVEYFDEGTSKWKLVSDHLWMNYTKSFKYFYPLKVGDIIYFDGKVTLYSYSEGVNLKVERPTKISVLRNGKAISKCEENVLDDYKLVEIINEENKEYYKARDYLQEFLTVPYYRFSLRTYGNIKALIYLDGKWIDREKFKKEYESRESVIKAYNKSYPVKNKIVILKKGKEKEISRKTIQKDHDEYVKSFYDDDEDYFDFP